MTTKFSDFINGYMRYIGVSEVPRQFHVLACLSLLAASLTDKCWFARDDVGGKIYPNLYVFLIGPSGSGKEKAITTAARFAEALPQMGLFASTGVTKQFLIDHLTRKPSEMYPDEPVNILYLVTEELGMSIPSKELGKDLIKFMTGHYVKSGITMREGTRMHGQKRLHEPMLNWLAGTTDEWLTTSVEKDAIMGGFFARVLSVRGRRDGSLRYAEMWYPPDREELRRRLAMRLESYTQLEAVFVKTPESVQYYKDWYESHEHRPSPTDPLLEATFNRTDEMVHRLAMLLTLSSLTDVPGYPCTIQVGIPQFKEAIDMWNCLTEGVPETLRRAAATRDSSEVEAVADIIRRAKLMDHSLLLKRAGNRGLNADKVRRALAELQDRGDIGPPTFEPVGQGKTRRTYTWTGG